MHRTDDQKAECRCAIDGGAWCYEQARRRAGGPAEVERIDWLWRSRAASGVPFHIIDKEVLRKIARIMAPRGTR